MDLFSHEYFMREAIREAQKALEKDEVPIGAIVVSNNTIIARGRNQVELLNDSTAHAEIIALTSAYQYLGAKYLPDAKLYVTIEPCLMCAGALQWSKIAEVIYGASDEKNGCSHYCNTNPYHPKTIVTKGVMQEECAKLVKDFFKGKRK